MTNTTIANQLYPFANALASSNPFVDVFEARDPTTSDINYPIQKKWLNTATDAFWELESFSSFNGITTANWVLIGSHAFVTETLTGNTGGPVPPTANNINVVGDGTKINVAGTPATSTLLITLGTDVATTYTENTGSATPASGNLNIFGTAPITTAGAGSTVTIATDGTVATVYHGDVGTATPSAGVINFFSTALSGSSASFRASGNNVDLFLSDGNSNLILGFASGNSSISGTANSIVGQGSGDALTTGSGNASIGSGCFNDCTTGSFNTALGNDSLRSLLTGTFNIAIGFTGGNGYVGAENSNIVIGNLGVASESNVIRIGTQGAGSQQQDTCYIAGIVGVTTSNSEMVTIDSTTGQLGVTPIPSPVTAITTITGDSGSVTGTTVDIFANHGSANCGSSVSFTAASATEMDLVIEDGNGNIILGNGAGNGSITGIDNFGVGSVFFDLTSGSNNCAFGFNNLNAITSGSHNTSLGFASGSSYTSTESSNILLNNIGVLGESNALHIGSGTGTGTSQLNSAFISGIQGIAVTGAPVLVSASDQLGVTVSSAKYKENIVPIGSSSKAIYDLRPSSFNYKHDPDKQRKFGLIAEEVHEVIPELVIYDKNGEPQSVAYHDLPVLLLNEIQRLKERIDFLEANVAV